MKPFSAVNEEAFTSLLFSLNYILSNFVPQTFHKILTHPMKKLCETVDLQHHGVQTKDRK